MTNALTRAGHGLTLAEKRIIGCAVSKLDSYKAIRPGDVPITRITAAEYVEAFGVVIPPEPEATVSADTEETE